jgi:oxalate decarboxylase/phosphoglucose isomerase-like protein (cupin superfamily)
MWMDVRSIEDAAPVVEHNGTVPIWDLVPAYEMKESTAGCFLELVCEVEVVAGGAMGAHSHPTHEFYYILSGRAIMQVADEEREVHAGDLIYTPPDTSHAIRPVTENGTVRLLAFALGLPGHTDAFTRNL